MSAQHQNPEDPVSAFEAKISWLEQRAFPVALTLLVVDLVTYGVVNLTQL
jgi:hypothetical protein